MASQHLDGEKPVSDIPPFLIVKCWIGNVFPNAHSAKLQIVCRLNMSKTAVLDTFTIKNFYVLYVWLVAILKGGQPASKGGGGECPPSPP